MKTAQQDYKSRLIFNSNEIDIQNTPSIDSHLHTNWTDGKASVKEVYSQAVRENLHTILFSEHSRKTSTDWFHKFVDEVRSLPIDPCRAFVGTEVKVENRSGEIDTNDEISGQCDFIMASVHRLIDDNNKTIQFEDTNPDIAVELEYQLTWEVLANPKVDILGHMFGMSYKRFNRVPPEHMIKSLIQRASEYNVAVEVNSHYHPSAIQMIQWCKELDAKITFGSNAHSLEQVGLINRQIKKELLSA